MQTYSFNKKAGGAIDRQDDVNDIYFNIFAEHWPKDLPEPDKYYPKEACIAYIDGKSRYPIDSPENTLSSSFYFLINADGFEKEAMLEIGRMLKEARNLWEIDLPDSFKQTLSLKKEAKYVDKNKVYKIDNKVQEAVEHFRKNASKMSAKERVFHEYNFEKKAGVEGMRWRKSSLAEESIMLREDMMKGIPKHDMYEVYLYKMASLRDTISKTATEDVGRIAYVVDEIERMDEDAAFDGFWNEYFPDPFESIVAGGDFEKEAEEEQSTWNVDWEGLSDVFSPEIIERIKENPDVIVPTLPAPQRSIFNQYVKV